MFPSFGTSLYKINSLLWAPFIDLLEVHFALQVFLAAQEQIAGLGHSFLCHLVPALFYPFPTLFAWEIEDQHHPITGFEVSRHDRAVSFLASSVPDA